MDVSLSNDRAHCGTACVSSAPNHGQGDDEEEEEEEKEQY